MNILILGASGFIGSWITRLLLEQGLNVLIASANKAHLNALFPETEYLICDFNHDLKIEPWLKRLENIDVIINCVGVFYHRDKEVIWNIHYNAPKVLYEAAQKTKVKQIIHISALGLNNYCNDYALSKKAIEEFLLQVDIPHIILRPSLVYGSGAGGGANLLKGLASFPLFLPLPGKGEQKFQPIYVEDLAKAVKNLVFNPIVERSTTLAAVSPQPIMIKNLLLTLRHQLGIKNTLTLNIPIPLIRFFAKFGNLKSNSIINSPAVDMLIQGNQASEEEAAHFQEQTNVVPFNFKQGIYKAYSRSKERILAQLQYVRPLLKVSLAFMWIMSAVSSILSSNKEESLRLLTQTGITTEIQELVLISAVLLNALIGVSLLMSYKIKFNCLIQILVILIYSAIITIKLPYLWLEPFGPVVKNIPILISIYILYILED